MTHLYTVESAKCLQNSGTMQEIYKMRHFMYYLMSYLRTFCCVSTEICNLFLSSFTYNSIFLLNKYYSNTFKNNIFGWIFLKVIQRFIHIFIFYHYLVWQDRIVRISFVFLFYNLYILHRREMFFPLIFLHEAYWNKFLYIRYFANTFDLLSLKLYARNIL